MSSQQKVYWEPYQQTAKTAHLKTKVYLALYITKKVRSAHNIKPYYNLQTQGILIGSFHIVK